MTTASGERLAAAAIVRAIRRAFGSQSGYRGLEAFHVADVHDFALRLAREGVRAVEDAP